jgi:glutaredoxin
MTQHQKPLELGRPTSMYRHLLHRLFPSCGFSNTAVRILDGLNVPYETVDVLADERIR